MQLRTMLIGILLFTASAAAAIETQIEVYALAHGAKFIGDGTGGAKITITDAASGEVLASGLTRGGTGDTDRLMDEQGGVHEIVATDDAASFTATLDLHTPTLVQVTAEGPMAHPHSAVKVSAQYVLIPGKHLVEGNGIMLTLPGFIIEVMATSLQAADEANFLVDARYRIHMLCGCPLSPDGLWDSNELEMWVEAEMADGTRFSAPMTYLGQPKLFGAEVYVPTRNVLSVTAYVVDPVRANTGVRSHAPEINGE